MELYVYVHLYLYALYNWFFLLWTHAFVLT